MLFGRAPYALLCAALLSCAWKAWSRSACVT
jgi:hypothetical protein